MYNYFIVLGGMKYVEVPVNKEIAKQALSYTTEQHVIHIPYKLGGPGSSERDVADFGNRIKQIEKEYGTDFVNGCMLISYNLLGGN